MGPKRSRAALSGAWDTAETGSVREKQRATTSAIHREWPVASHTSEIRSTSQSIAHSSPGSLLPARIVDLPGRLAAVSHDMAQLAEDEQGSSTASDVIFTIDMKEDFTLGCAFFSSSNCCLSLGQDLALADADVLEQMLVYVQPTAIIISSRAPELLRSFIEESPQLASQSRCLNKCGFAR